MTLPSKDERQLRDVERTARVRELEQAGIDPAREKAMWARADRAEEAAHYGELIRRYRAVFGRS